MWSSISNSYMKLDMELYKFIYRFSYKESYNTLCYKIWYQISCNMVNKVSSYTEPMNGNHVLDSEKETWFGQIFIECLVEKRETEDRVGETCGRNLAYYTYTRAMCTRWYLYGFEGLAESARQVRLRPRSRPFFAYAYAWRSHVHRDPALTIALV